MKRLSQNNEDLSRRVADDKEYWKSQLSEKTQVEQKRDGRDVRFRLVKPDDFHAFSNAWSHELQTKTFSELGEDDGDATDQDT